MCGIAGWVDFARDLTADRAAAETMTRTMARRGPDDEGIWIDRHVALGHRRLAVIDVEGGHQPMAADGPAVVTYSGEIYNFAELREALEAKGHRFRTGSDTEVLLRGYLEWGEEVVGRLNGIFAFGLWDARREELLLVRDRMGVKPLFYYPLPDGVLFGSEPKAILAHPLAAPVVDADGLRELLTLVKTPERAVFKGMYEVRPGCLLRVRREGIAKRRYWALESREHTDDIGTTVAAIRELLDDIIARQLVSDVPICTLLSGGLDSSTITALAKRHQEIRSFSVDFTGYAENFAPDEMRVDADKPFVEELVRYVRPHHTAIVLDTDELTDPRLRWWALRAWDRPHVATGGTALDPAVVEALVRPVVSPGGLLPAEEDLLSLIAEGRTIKAIAAIQHVPAEAVDAEVGAVFIKLASGVSAGDQAALNRLRLLHQAIVDREEQGETLSRLLPSGLAAKLRGAAPRIGETERVTVTVLMSDIRSYTTIAEHADPSELAGQLNTHRAAMNRAILGEGGTVMQFVGDAVMAVFGAPFPQPDHADRAVGAAAGMHALQEEINRGWRSAGLPEFGLGIGLSTGQAAAALLGSEERLEYTLVGDTVNLAQRLQQFATAGETVLSEATRDVLTAAVPVIALPAQLVKGRDTPVVAYKITQPC